MDLKILKKLGLSDGEIKVYQALLELGETTINNIHEKIGIDRRNIYDILNKLIEKGLISYIESNKKRSFKVSNPDKLISYIHEKKSNLDNIEKEIDVLIPDMQQIFNLNKEEFRAETFKGKEGLKAVWDDMLNYKEIFWIGSGMYVPDKFPAYFKDWNKRRLQRKVKSFHLYRNEKRNDVEKYPDKNIFTDCRFLPPEFSGNPTFTTIYGDKVANTLIGENIFVFVIESKELAENYRKYHKYLWDKVAKK